MLRKVLVVLAAVLAISILAACASQVTNAPSAQTRRGTVSEPTLQKLDSTPRIALESAFGAELELLLQAADIETVYVINGRRFHVGKLEGKNVVMFLSGGSMYNSALTTQAAFDHFNVDRLIFSGIAGGINPALGIGDVVIGTQSAEYMELLAARENPDGTYQIPPWFTPSGKNFLFLFPQSNFITHKGGEPDKEDMVRWFPGDQNLVNAARNVAAKVELKQCGLDDKNQEVCLDQQPKIVAGNLVMGPIYMDNKAMREWVYDVFQADALAMEEVYHACAVNAKPCLMLRSLSDLAGGGPGENEILTFFRIAADNSAMLVLEILKELPLDAGVQVSLQAPEPAPSVGFQIPEVEEGKYNVAFIYIGPHDDAGWTQAHDMGRQYVEANMPDVHTAYVELVPEGAEAEQVIRSLARKGFNAIIATSFGYMDPMAAVAEEYPDTKFLHVSGFKTNGKNFGNMFGGMETIKYMAGMIAGARAQADGVPQVGYIATFPIPEEFRLGNAFALGVQRVCPECKVDVRWINTWHDPVKEKDAAASLFDAGSHVVMTGADTPANAEAAKERGKWAITYDYEGNCKLDSCLTTMYWNWGPIYAADITNMMNGAWTGGFEYFDVVNGGLGLYGFMDGQTPQPGVPEEVILMVRETLADALAGSFNRFSVFSGPIRDNKGNVVVPSGEKINQCDVDQFAAPAAPENPNCPAKYGMYWWNENVIAELPSLK